MKPILCHRLLALSAVLVLSGCPVQQAILSGNNPVTSAATVPAQFTGHVSVPQALVSNNAGGLVSNNAGGLVSNNAGGYRVSALSEIPLSNSLVYLLTTDEQFYNDLNGARIVTTTTASGDYTLPTVLPLGKQVIVSALLAGNRRMTGFTVTQTGANQVNLSVATTYVTEFLRAYAARQGKTMGDYPNVLQQLPAIVAETQAMLNSGLLPLPDLTIGNAAAMNKVYFAAFAANDQLLSNLWTTLLGTRLIGLSTVVGNYRVGSVQDPGPATQIALNNPTGVAVDGQGMIYVAANQSHVIWKVTLDGQATPLGKFRGDGTITTPVLATDSVQTFANVALPLVQDVKCDPDGNLIACFQISPGTTPHNSILAFFCNKTGTYFTKAMTAGNVYPLGHDANSDDLPGTPAATDSAATRYRDGFIDQARFDAPNGLCVDDRGNVFVADRVNNAIRRIDRTTGIVSTVGGRILSSNGTPYPDLLATWDGVSNVTGAATQSVITRPFAVAWRRTGVNTEELYVWEGTNLNPSDPAFGKGGNAIVRIAYNGANPTAGTAAVIAGGTGITPGYSGDGGAAATASIFLVDKTNSNIPNGGIAIGPDPNTGMGRYLYFCDSMNYRIRVIDLGVNPPTINTAAGGGTIPGDTEAKLAQLKDVSGLTVDASGSVYFCDAVNQVVRKLNYQFGRQ
jgi:hypothetical protein